MPRELALSLNQSAFLLRTLAKGLRADGRTPYQLRPVQLAFGDDFGSVQATLGNTVYASSSSSSSQHTRHDGNAD